MRAPACSVLLLCLVCGSALAADFPSAPPPAEQPAPREEGAWKFVIAPYMLGPTISGTSRIGRLPTTDLNVSPGTIFENLQFGAMGHVEVLYDNRFGASLDVAYMDLGSGRTFPAVGGSVKASVKQMVTEGFFGYRFWSEDRNWAEAYAGGRWWYNQLSVDANVPGNTFSRTITEQWVDPVIGIRGQYFLSDTWSLYGSGNIGGFGLVSEFTWGAQAGVGYHFNENWALHLQYKAVGVNYDNGKSGRPAFSYDTITHGPLLGVAFSF